MNPVFSEYQLIKSINIKKDKFYVRQSEHYCISGLKFDSRKYTTSEVKSYIGLPIYSK